MKTTNKIFLVLALTMALVLVLGGCREDVKYPVSSIAVTHAPTTSTYSHGDALDLS
ncbi:MAG: hypothetical protein LKE39_09140 [Sphaerochaeta sp.]|jgi:uncharacterized lipoprotein YehR (DUF1307 family)|nr:hypothetical protein [Sphaerochaeta sp.]